jgi:putative copper resistance protein D
VIDASFAALAAARWLHFLAAMLLFGAALFPFYAASDDLTASPAVLNSARRAVRVAAVLTAISAFAWAAILLITITGAADSLIDRDTLSAFFFDTGFGKVWALRLLLALAIPFVAFVAGNALFARGLPTALIALLTGSLLVSQAWVGHAAASGAEAWIVVLGYALHVLGAGVWIGGLVPLELVLRESNGQTGEAYLDRALYRFSQTAMIAIAAILAGGLINVWARWRSLEALLASTWGQLVLLKMILFAALLALAIQNRFVLMPRLLANVGSRRHLVGNVVIEQLGAIAILGAASLLGITAPPG